MRDLRWRLWSRVVFLDCLRLAAHPGQYLARLEPGTKAVPHIAQRRVGRTPFWSTASNAGLFGSTAYRNHLQFKEPEFHCGQMLHWG